MTAPHLKLGKLGEDIAVKHLVKLGHKKLEQNYRQKWGEIDIITKKKEILHFVEVKTVSYETDYDDYIPEENIRKFKKQRLKRTINTYLTEKKVSGETDFQIDVIAIFLNPITGEHKLRFLEDVIL